MHKIPSLIVVALVFGTLPMRAGACTVIGPSVAETAREVAATGLVVSGEIIQGFNADKRQPEIVRVDRVFVGNAAPGEFVISYSKHDYEAAIESRRLQKEGRLVCSGFGPPHYKVGQSFERLVLMPAATTGKWSFHFWGDQVLSGVGFEMLVANAKELRRLNALPPKSRQWGDCMTCVPRGD